jgi:hypothetical protein
LEAILSKNTLGPVGVNEVKDMKSDVLQALKASLFEKKL